MASNANPPPMMPSAAGSSDCVEAVMASTANTIDGTAAIRRRIQVQRLLFMSFSSAARPESFSRFWPARQPCCLEHKASEHLVLHFINTITYKPA
jgi:hypothetical protein